METVTIRSLAVLLAFALNAQQPTLPRAPGAHIVDITQPARFSEPGICVHPKHPSQVVGVYQGAASVQGSANAAYSTDGGTTYTIAKGTRALDWKVQGDVTTT